MTKGMKVALGCGIAGVVALAAVLVVAAAFAVWAARHADASSGRVAATGSAEHRVTPSPPQASRFVLIDTREQAYTVYLAFPSDLLDRVRERQAGQADTEIIDWDAFRRNAASRIKSRIERYDDIPESQFVPQVIELIASAGGPIGVTWNGGVAITYTDYQTAKRRYAEAH